MKNLMRTTLTNLGLSFGAFGTNPDKLCGANPNYVTINGRITGERADLVILDDIEPSAATLDDRSDYAEAALDAYTDIAGSTGSDHQDVVELIADLLHLLDDLYPEAGERALHYTTHLLDALKTYRRDLATN